MALSSQAQRVTDHGVVVDGDEGDKPSWSEPERQVLDQSFSSNGLLPRKHKGGIGVLV